MWNDLKFLGSVLFVIFFCVTPLFYLAGNIKEKDLDDGKGGYHEKQ